MHPLTHNALRAARDAGKLIVRAMQDLERIEVTRKSANDYVSQVDRTAENIILQLLKKAYPDHAFVAEESGLNGREGAEFTWFIDPLDGTTNFLRGIPHYCISICCTVRGRPEHAVVYDPVRDEEFTATRGGGAQLSGRRIRVSKRPGLDEALLGTGIPFRPEQEAWAEQYFPMLEKLAGETAGIRRAGSAALDLAYVAAGRFDGFWESGLKAWDIAAGALLVQEAGGMVSDFAGNHDYLKNGNIIAANPKIQKILLQRVREARAG